jgi:excisionase family DNA binding protein
MTMASRATSDGLQVPTAFQGLLVGNYSAGDSQLPLLWPSRDRRATAAPSLLNVREVAARLSVHENTVRNWIDKGVLRAARLPSSGYRRIPTTEVDRIQRAIYGDLASMNTGPAIDLPSDATIDIVHHDRTP